MRLSDVFDKRLIRLSLESKTKEDAFKELIGAIAEIHPEFERDTMFAVILERENKMNTSIASGVAIPHGYYPGTGVIRGALGISEAGIDYGSPDGKPVHCIFLIIMGAASRENHLRVLNKLMALVNSDGVNLLRKAPSPEAIHDILSRVH